MTLDRKLPAVFIRLLLSLYTGHVACVLWNVVYSGQFPVENGVKQGGILSPVLFCVYTDGLLNGLAKCHVGCYIGMNLLVLLAMHDIVLLASTPLAIRKLLNICDDYAREESIIFNGRKSKCIFYPGSKEVGYASKAHVIPSLQVGGSDIEYVDSWTYLVTFSLVIVVILRILNIGVFKPFNKSMTYLVILVN